jgi:hypothetical protein
MVFHSDAEVNYIAAEVAGVAFSSPSRKVRIKSACRFVDVS